MATNTDPYFYRLCCAIALNSKCLSRQIGAILVRDKLIVSTGYNGPPRGVTHCGQKDFVYDSLSGLTVNPAVNKVCPRHLLLYKSGEGLHLCPAAHAETNAIANAARLGVNCSGATLYLNAPTPCRACAPSVINAGIVEVVALSLEPYDELGLKLLNEAGVKVRVFVPPSQEF